MTQTVPYIRPGALKPQRRSRRGDPTEEIAHAAAFDSSDPPPGR
jgi:hypothetical protein